MSSIPEAHPSWCDRQHNPDYPVHTAEIGDDDIPVGDVGLAVSLYQHGEHPPQVWLARHTFYETQINQLTPEQAAELGRRLIDAAARTRPPAPPPADGGGWTDTGSGPGWTR